MIGKLMSEAAHSIIGMFTARPGDMESNPSNFDFGSLLRTPEEQPQSGSKKTEIDSSDIENADVGDTDVDPAQHWETTNVLPLINQTFGSRIFNQGQSQGKIEQDQTITDPVDVDLPEGKLSLAFNRDVIINPATLQVPNTLGNARSTASAADGDVHQAAAKSTSDILSPQAKAILDNGSKTEIAPIPGLPKSADGQAVDDGLLELKSSQHKMGGETGESAEPAARAAKSNEFRHSHVQFNDLTNKLETGKLAPAFSPLLTKGTEHKDTRSELGQFGFRSSPRDILPVARTGVSTPIIADDEFAEPFKLDLQPTAKNVEKWIEQQPLVNSAAQLAVRETNQKPVSFDMSSPQIAERLAAEIADLSVSGGTKKFEINPRNLGRMEINFSTRGATEIIEIQTEHRAAKDIIVQHSQLLQDMLKSQGRDDLTFRVDVKENIFTSSRNDGGNLSQQENRDTPEQHARPPQHRQGVPSFDGTAENGPASDNSRYA